MIKTLDMKFIRYVNLFERVTKVGCNHCFEYNNSIVFAVPKNLVMRAIGRDNSNLEELGRMIGKKIKIVAIPRGIEDIESFVSTITRPVKFKAIEVRDDEATITAGTQSKASLIGKNKIRLGEMENILEQYFGIKRVKIK